MKAHYLGHRQRLKERFIQAPDSLHDYELIELMLGFVIKGKDVKPLAKGILGQVGGIQKISSADLSDISGVGPETDLFFKSIFEYSKRIEKERSYDSPYCIDSPESIYNFLKHLIGHEAKERFVAVFLDGKNAIIHHSIIFSGTVNQAAVYPREIAKQALEINAVSILFAHNHPSGNLSPSDDDLILTNKLVEVMGLFDISVLDHIIIGREGFYSFKKNGDF